MEIKDLVKKLTSIHIIILSIHFFITPPFLLHIMGDIIQNYINYYGRSWKNYRGADCQVDNGIRYLREKTTDS